MLEWRKKRFTLIELLLIIAVIAILAALLFPGLARARETAKAIQCISNQKQIGVLNEFYAANYKYYTPWLTNTPSWVLYYAHLTNEAGTSWMSWDGHYAPTKRSEAKPLEYNNTGVSL